MMANKSEEFFHDKWLGHVQTESDGLVVAKPVLLAAGCAQQQPPGVQEKLRELCPLGPDDAPRRITDLMQLFKQLLDFDAELFDNATEIADEISLYAPEGPQTIRPTLGLLHKSKPEPNEGAGSPASNAAAKYVAFIWDVTECDGEFNEEAVGLMLDKPETTTGEWSYPAAAKFDRLLRHCQVPVGILTNREVIRLVYAPHGESSGYITFRVDDMATVGGRPILDAMIMLLCANQWFGVSDENSLPLLLRRSREYQGTVTEDLAEQVFSGLETLLQGFQEAAERDKTDLLLQALEQDDDHLYRGLLTVMLRLVFILYAEDRSLLPVEHPLYAKRMSLLGLFERLQRDHGNFPDSMNNRFGAWGHIVSLCRAIYLGVDHDDFHIPPRQGDLFDPHRFKFLEGWTGESAPVITQKARSEVQVPTVDDGAVFSLLRSLLIFQGQRLSYRTLDVEQIGSVYEALMGYHVNACKSQAIAIKIKNKKGAPKYWLELDALQSVATAQRLKWLQNDCGFDKAIATKIKRSVDAFEKSKPEERGTLVDVLLPFAAGKKDITIWNLAQTGQYILQPGAERRRSGSHYTPRSLTSPIVQKVLQPLLRCFGDVPTAEQILELKLCDPAMGSGAFLVECCRQLADEVVAAWGREKQTQEISILCPEGDVVAHARRLVAQRCLYGVDKNVMAVQLAKLSLWLFTLARQLPFTFLDHSLRYGDSLVGLSFEQIKAFHWQPEHQMSFLEEEVNNALDEVVAIRQEIHALAGDATPAGQKLKAQRLFDANDATEKVRKIADICVGAFFHKDKNTARLAERQHREDIVRLWLSGDEGAEVSVDCRVKEIRDLHAPFHWWLEFPEVFYEERRDPLSDGEVNGAAYMDGLVGNPPFMNKDTLTASLGLCYSDWLRAVYSGDTGVRGACDICAYFFRRCTDLIAVHGALGLVATNTICQGDTRKIGLKNILTFHDSKIFDAVRSMPWPGRAAVAVSIIHIAYGACKAKTDLSYLDSIAVPFINSRLKPKPERADAIKLISNKGVATQGSVLLGQGFTISIQEFEELSQKSIINSERLFPYIGGEVNTSPAQMFSRYVINFENRTLDESKKWPDLLNIVIDHVKPERDKQKGDHSTSRRRRDIWWQFDGVRSDLYSALTAFEQCLVTVCSATKHLMFSFQPTNRVFSHSLYVFLLESYSDFSILQSRVHEPWARLLSSDLEGRLRYTAGDCFDTFPFPPIGSRELNLKTEQAGESLYSYRAEYMIATSLGLTKIYNKLKDPECDDDEVVELRRLHESIDRAVLDAYGWTDIDVPPYCPLNPKDEEDVEAFNDEVIDRLYVLNGERAAKEELQGLAMATTKKKAPKNSLESNPTLNLF